jgi:hypothetical protein
VGIIPEQQPLDLRFVELNAAVAVINAALLQCHDLLERGEFEQRKFYPGSRCIM